MNEAQCILCGKRTIWIEVAGRQHQFNPKYIRTEDLRGRSMTLTTLKGHSFDTKDAGLFRGVNFIFLPLPASTKV